MHLAYRNVNDAFCDLVTSIGNGNIATSRSASRYGDVITIEEPVIIQYLKPTEKVLFNRGRDCNPFFHVYEALWMLAGRNDVAPLVTYNKRMSEFSDDGSTFNGAYGYRWRESLPLQKTNRRPAGWSDGRGGVDLNDWEMERVDQLKIIIAHLCDNPESRRVVLQMWNVEEDLLKIDTSKDVCCNLCVMFRIRKETKTTIPIGDPTLDGKEYTVSHLDMTVINRSNDLVWGMLGANAVHFAFLQEYMAYAVGCEVGHYYQISNNLHCYTKTWEPEKWESHNSSPLTHLYRSYKSKNLVGLMDNPTGATKEIWVGCFDAECSQFVEYYSKPGLKPEYRYDSEFLDKVAEPMMQAFSYYKEGDIQTCSNYLDKIEATDWRIACTNWVATRLEKRGTK